MKKVFSLILVLAMLMSVTAALAESDNHQHRLPAGYQRPDFQPGQHGYGRRTVGSGRD